MHGIIFLELKKYVELRWDKGTWRALLADTGLLSRVYLPVQEYPDDELLMLVETMAKTTGLPTSGVLEDFAEFIVPDLLQIYRSLVHANWKTLDLLENTEKMVRRVVRLRNPGAHAPELLAERRAPNEVAWRFRSARRMCGVAKGIARGAAKHYGERIAIQESQCMHSGAAECIIELRLTN